MIKTSDLKKICDEGWKFRICSYEKGNSVKGRIFPDEYEIRIYKKRIENNEDYYLTICHEIFHVLDENLSEKEVESNAYVLKERFPKKLEYIINLFDIPPYKNII